MFQCESNGSYLTIQQMVLQQETTGDREDWEVSPI